MHYALELPRKPYASSAVLLTAVLVLSLTAAFLVSPPAVAQTPYIYGMHDASPAPTEFLNRAQNAGRTVWITATEAIGHNPSDTGGANYTQFSNAGHTVISRLNNGYGDSGTIPVPSQYSNFAQRCASFVANTQGCDIFIIGNETNLAAEWPRVNGYRSYISPESYASCFRQAYNAIKAVRPSAQVLCQALAPFAGPYPAGPDHDGVPIGWTQYMYNMLTAINSTGGLDGIAVHINSRGYTYADVHSTAKVNGQFFSFYVYKDWVYLGTPASLRTKPYYATECNGIYFWKGGHPECNSCGNPSCCYQNNWVQWIYAEINAWNQAQAASGVGIYRCVNMYRWCSWCDDWNIDASPQKNAILNDFDAAYAAGYQWPSGGGGSPTATPTPTQAPSGQLISQGKPVTTDSNYDGNTTGAKMVDGVITGNNNRWVSGSAGNSHHWFYIDLQSSYHLDQLWLYSAEANGEDWSYNIKTFTVHGSNSASGAVNTWTQLASYNGTGNNDYPGTGADAHVTLALSGNYRYVGVDITCSDSICGTHARVQETKIFGTAAATPTPVPPTATPTPTPTSGGASLLSQGKPVTTDSNFNGTLTGAKIVDGVIPGNDNRWVSGSAGDSHHWFYIDLQQTYNLSEFRLYSAEANGEDWSYNIKTFTVRGSSTGSGAVSSWTQLASYNGTGNNDYPGSGSNAHVALSLSGSYRYVGVDITCSDGICGTHARVQEAQVYGTAASPTNTPTPVPSSTPDPGQGCTLYTWNNASDASEVDSAVESSGGWGGTQIAGFTSGVSTGGQTGLRATQDYGASYFVWNFSGLTPNSAIDISMDVNVNCTDNDSWVEVYWGGGLRSAFDGKGALGAPKAKWDSTGAGNGTSSGGWTTIGNTASSADANGNFTVGMEIGHWSSSPATVSVYIDNLDVCEAAGPTHTPTATPTPVSAGLVSQGKPVTTDSDYNSTLTGDKMVDGTIPGNNNRWVSGSAGDSHHWFIIDLQALHDLTEFRLYGAEANGEDWSYNIWAFTVHGSNTGTGDVDTWAELASYTGSGNNDYPGSGAAAHVALTLSGSYRYVGVDITCSDNICGTHARVQEAQVYGSLTQSPPTPTPTPQPAGPVHISLDPGAPISASTGDIGFRGDLIQDSGAGWTRINFILGPWNSPSDSTPRGAANRTWFETYDLIINDAIGRGLDVIGLIGAEAVKSSHALNSSGYVADYTANFVAIVDHFKDRVRTFESFNEPNDWAGGTSAQVTPYYFAKMLEDIYRAVKIDNGHSGDPDWQVTLVSGPLFSHDADTGASYFTSTWTEGKNNLGWNDFHNAYGKYPLDGVGYHLYVAQGTANPTTVANALDGNMDAIWSSVTSLDGSGTALKLWVTEFGWNSASISEANQAANVTTALGFLTSDSRVALANWFQLRDFGSTDFWGLERSDGSKKPSWAAYTDFTGGGSGVPTVVYTWNASSDPSEVDSIVESSGGWGGSQTASFTSGFSLDGRQCLRATQDYGSSYWVWNIGGLTPNTTVSIALDVNVNCSNNSTWFEVYWASGTKTASQGKGAMGSLKEKWDSNGAGNGVSSNGWVTIGDSSVTADGSGNVTVAVELGHWSGSPATVSAYVDNLTVTSQQ